MLEDVRCGRISSKLDDKLWTICSQGEAGRGGANIVLPHLCPDDQGVGNADVGVELEQRCRDIERDLLDVAEKFQVNLAAEMGHDDTKQARIH